MISRKAIAGMVGNRSILSKKESRCSSMSLGGGITFTNSKCHLSDVALMEYGDLGRLIELR
jgi:hypothetical protein